MRCPSCNKFVSLEAENEPEINVTVDEEGVITGDVRIVNTCAECGEELSEATFTVEADVSDQVTDHRENAKGSGEKESDHGDLDVDDDGGSRTDEYADKDRHGKPIKSARYRKHFYGAEVEFTVTCKCGETFTTHWNDKVQASGMESLN